VIVHSAGVQKCMTSDSKRSRTRNVTPCSCVKRSAGSKETKWPFASTEPLSLVPNADFGVMVASVLR